MGRMFRFVFLLLCLTIAALAVTGSTKEQQAADAYLKKDYSAALTLYRDLTGDDAKRPQFRYRLAFCELQTGDAGAALKDFQLALKLGSLAGPTHYNLGCTYIRLGEKGKALDELDACVATGFQNVDQLKSDEDYKTLAAEPRFVALVDKLENPLKGVAGADALDHWVGEWTVTMNGQFAGENTITKILRGYGVTEHWRGTGGTEGNSLFTFDQDKKEWRHLWTSNSGWTVTRIGKPVKGGIYFEGTSVTPGTKDQKTREWITKNDDGSVRQLIEIQDPKTKKWSTSFDGHYVRKQ